MVLLATDALSLTNTSVTQTDSADLQTEVSLAETQIRQATSFGLYSITYNATIIGNPAVDPRTETLPQQQDNFYTAFVQAGYVVSLDRATGYWLIDWKGQGAETLVSIYSFRTTFDPSAILTSTNNAITAFFNLQVPVIHVSINYNGNIDETSFGGSGTTFYEFTVVADQESDLTNYAADLKTHLVAQGLGYNSGNCAVYQMVV